MRIRRDAALLIAAGSLLTLPATACASGRSSQEQWTSARVSAPAGARVYQRECASCHGEQGEGSRGVPEVVGPDSLPTQRAGRPPLATALDLYAYVSKTMPLPAKRAGTLPSDEYWAVVELMLRARGVDLPDEGIKPQNASGVPIN